MTPSRLAQHSKASPEWGTPASIVELARELMGGIDLDPASSPEFNQTVKADLIYTKDNSGLDAKDWRLDIPEWRQVAPGYKASVATRVFLNPPGGLVKPFWERLLKEYHAVNVTQALWVGFSLEQLLPLQDCDSHPLSFPTVIPRKRIKFGGRNNPTHGNYITWLPPFIGISQREAENQPWKFQRLFEDLGYVSISHIWKP